MSNEDHGRARPAHKPQLHADLTALIDAHTSYQPQTHAELASATAAAVLRAGREGQQVVTLSDRVGLETLAELWRDAEPVSLAGALWMLYALRQWWHTCPDEAARLWRAGSPLAPADAVVAGVPHAPEPAELAETADSVLARAYQGDFAVSLERAAAAFTVCATGRRWYDEHDALAERNAAAASALRAAAARWRAGTLS